MKWVIELERNGTIDVKLEGSAQFIEYIKKILEHNGDEGIKEFTVKNLERYLEDCKNRQHMYLIFSDSPIKVRGEISEVMQEELPDLIDEEDMEI